MEELSVTSFISVSWLFLLLSFNTAWVLMETLIDVLDGAMVTIAMYTINIGHPGMLLGSFRNTQVDGNGRA